MLEDEGAEGREVVADSEVSVGEIEDCQHHLPHDQVAGRWLGDTRRFVDPPRYREPEGPYDKGKNGRGLRREQRQLRKAALDVAEWQVAFEIASDRFEQVADNEPVDAEQEQQADTDLPPAAGPGAGRRDEDDGDGEVEEEDRRCHPEIVPANRGDLGRRGGGGDVHARRYIPGGPNLRNVEEC